MSKDQTPIFIFNSKGIQMLNKDFLLSINADGSIVFLQKKVGDEHVR